MSTIVYGSAIIGSGGDDVFEYISGTKADNNLEYQFNGDIGTKVNLGKLNLNYGYVDYTSDSNNPIQSIGFDSIYVPFYVNNKYYFSDRFGRVAITDDLINSKEIENYDENYINTPSSDQPNFYFEPNYHPYKSIAYNGSIYVRINTYTTTSYYWTSTDGIKWTTRNFPSYIYSRAVCYGSGKFVILSLNSGIGFVSSDGINWTQISIPLSSAVHSLAYGAGKYVAVSTSWEVAYSIDGINWTKSDASVYATEVKFLNGKFWAYYERGYSRIYSSDDGITWAEHSLPREIINVEYANNTFLAISTYSYCYTSSDGINWTQYNLPRSVTYILSLFYANGQWSYFSYDGYIFTSSDNGVSWTTVSSNSVSPYLPSKNLYHIVEADEKYYFFGGGKTVGVLDKSRIKNNTDKYFIINKILVCPCNVSCSTGRSIGVLYHNNKWYLANSSSESGVPVYYTTTDFKTFTPSTWMKESTRSDELMQMTYQDGELIFVLSPNPSKICISKNNGEDWQIYPCSRYLNAGVYKFKGKYYYDTEVFSDDFATLTTIPLVTSFNSDSSLNGINYAFRLNNKVYFPTTSVPSSDSNYVTLKIYYTDDMVTAKLAGGSGQISRYYTDFAGGTLGYKIWIGSSSGGWVYLSKDGKTFNSSSSLQTGIYYPEFVFSTSQRRYMAGYSVYNYVQRGVGEPQLYITEK